MKKPNPLFSAYVESVEGRRQAAQRLGITAAMVGHLITGERTVSPRIALAVHADSGGHFDKARFRPDLWGEAANNKND
jgi:DNA-binding transcriptional regulator YdaS (Cro superfamily)